MKIAILGATGAVGRQMVECIEEQNIPCDELKLLASARSVGVQIPFQGKNLTVEEACETSFEGMDIVLGAASNALAKKFAPYIVKAGAVFIDNSSAFRMDPEVPLVVPEINGEDAGNHKGIISNPNCSTIIACMAIAAIDKQFHITNMIASTYQAVSGAGKNGITELENQIANTDMTPSVFPYQIAYNCIPCIGSPSTDDYTTEEMKMENEGRKILHNHMNVTCTCVRVPVMRSHSVSISLQTEIPVTVQQATQAIAAFPNVQIKDDLSIGCYPMPLDTSNQDDVFVGRIRKDRVLENGISLFCCGDQIRKGAASNAVQIIKCL
ncbi:MAG: aspartate-semialdehyde dehydrogenase [Erysipelotrichaceae bacterium]|nr:aspartate-semialdehyde dehydrogenase [Erysipelotrichaceae bacterium]